MALTPGTNVDSYELVGLLGAGGMGEVYRARDSVLKRDVAVKVLPSFVSRDPDRLRRFEQEAQATAALNHPNILAVHQFGVFEGAPYLVSELLEGGTLRQLLERGPLPIRKAIDYGVQIAHGLAAAHEKGIVHRDLKPENLFVTKDGRVKILDFGLAKLIQHHPEPDASAPTMTQQTDPGMVMGTAGYMSPEQVRGKTVDHRTDIFAFGAILYEMLTGKRAFHRSTSAETMTAILNEDPPGISQIVQTTLPGLQRVVHRCLEKNPEQRFHSAADLAFALESLSDSGSAAVVATAPRGRLRRPLMVAAGVLAACSALLIAWWRMPAAVPVVESMTQLTEDGHPKRQMETDGLRIYYQNPDVFSIRQVSVTGGATAPVETGLTQSWLAGITHDSSALLVAVPADSGGISAAPWLVPVPAGEPRRIGNFELTQAELFPDGHILFAEPSRESFSTDWSVAESNGSNPHKVATLPGSAYGDASVSPDGQQIVLTQEQASNRRLFEMAADGTRLHEIRKLTESEQNFRWTPDGKYLVYQAGSELQSDIWLLPMKTELFGRRGGPIRLTHGPLPYSFPCPSRDGKQIFVLGSRERGELVRYDTKSKQFVPLLSGISATEPTFSRDGKWVVYSSFPDRGLWRSRSDGSERMQLTYAPVQVIFPQISPDGTKVAFFTPGGGGDVFGDVFLISMAGGTAQKIIENACCATWSPDGNSMFYQRGDGSAGTIADLGTGKKFAVPSSQGIFAFWLDQHTLIAPNEKGTSLVTFDRKAGKWTDLAPLPPGGIEHWMMSPDFKYFYFSIAGSEPRAMRLRIADSQIETITSLKDFHRVVNHGNTQINVAPDGSPIFTRDTGYQEIYALTIRWP